MKWHEVKVETASEAVEAVSNIMMEFGASGVAIEDALDIENFSSDPFGEYLEKSVFDHISEGAQVMAYFPETVFLPEILPAITQRITELADFGLAIGKNQVSVAEVEESDWATAWKKYYHPVAITRYLTVVPDWEQYEPAHADECVITLDPGMAFGTGTHPTTRLSLQALETVMRGGETVIDVGTGSGVLSIAAKYLGADSVYAYDLDEVAVDSAKANMALNDIAKDVHVSANNLLDGIKTQADVIVANILADIIIRLVPDAWRCLKADGSFIISGIILDKEDDVLETVLAQGFEVDQRLQQQDWLTFILKKREED